MNSAILIRMPVQAEQAVINMLIDTGALASLMNANDFKRNLPCILFGTSHPQLGLLQCNRAVSRTLSKREAFCHFWATMHLKS